MLNNAVRTLPLSFHAVTPPEPRVSEHEWGQLLLDNGIENLHVRKPNMSADELREYLLSYVDKGYAGRLVLHSHYHLCTELGLGGIHITEAAKVSSETWHQYPLTSIAVHNLDELQAPQIARFRYAVVSPVFPSISKKGYHPHFTLDQLAQAIPTAHVPVVALGGITPEHCRTLYSIGCCGILFLGYLWETTSRRTFQKRLDTIRDCQYYG